MALTDLYERKHDYLRISVTDRCNLRCLYCMDPEGVTQIPHNSILTYEEILEVVKAGAALGISRIRLTGGEPLVRKGLLYLVEEIARVREISDLAMTTNGILLPDFAGSLKEAGLQRVNISLDSLKPAVYRKVTRGGELEQALSGIEAALDAGLTPVKLNVVLMKGINHTEVPAFLKLALERELHLRFIEYMPIGTQGREHQKYYLPLSYVRENAARIGLPLTPVESPPGAGPAESFSLPGGKGTIGLIHPISRHFCASCNRLRLTAEGYLKSCLYWQEERSVRPALEDPAAMQELLQEVVRIKPEKHCMSPQKGAGSLKLQAMREMSKIGG
ncbi:MAG: GTP 3',8-cyclase MoaA [Dethiobacteria bacterium]|nr:GTP 3',8-cyclase MoaA [Bacillota bacterium]HOB29548.1 GTP 3',8-cyclase MoaA [Bacillota bacterium]HPZ42091.1 GTP 3',8-cyclase MoaA [Bacillota bacterium]HQD52235.1 GTP 3',8-cyclase MoaA [Bacillota bacterium]